MSTLHLRCGSDIRDSLQAAGIAGDFLEWSDPVCQGPVRALPEGEYLELRRSWLSRAWDIPRAELDAKLAPASSLPGRLADHAEICLWFEHDLYDQSMLVQVLATLAEHGELHPRMRLVSTDRHPEIERFIGFGQLRPEQLPACYEARTPIPVEAFELARRAWDALREPSPDRLRAMDWRSEALPYLAGAIARHLQEFPDPSDGLGLTQRLSLQAIAEANARMGVAFAAQIFSELIGARDPAPWYGDLMYWAYLRELAAEPGALITMLGDFPSEQLALTPAGEAVLAGEARWREGLAPPEFGPSRWRGGVELRALGPPGAGPG